MNRVESTTKPNKIESLGNGYWYYNYDIQETTKDVPIDNTEETEQKTFYNFVQVRIKGNPTYAKCVKAIIREYIDDMQEFDYINSYNSYQLGIGDDDPDYQEYLNLLKTIKANVATDLEYTPTTNINNAVRQIDIQKLMLMTINTMSLTDSQALEVKSLYPNWSDFIGKQLEKDFKVQYNGKLFKVVQTHTAQEDWKPGISTASLFTEIVEDHAGTIDDPIPYPADGNMVIYNGKYYIDNGIIYKCIRDSQQPLYTSLANVVNNYVELVEHVA